MWPTLMEIETPFGSSGLHTYGLLVMTGFLAAFGVLQMRARQVGVRSEQLIWLYGAAALGGLVGARVLYVVAVGDLGALTSCQGGFAYYGGVLGGAALVVLTARRQGLHLWKLADISLPAVILGNAVGRLGCFFAGCCHGMAVWPADPATALLPEGLLHGQIYIHPHFPFLSTEFHTGVGRLLNEPLYPTQLWQSAGAFLVFILLSVVWRQRRFDGQVAGMALLLEPTVRVFVEAFRADHRGYMVEWVVRDAPEWLHQSWLRGVASAGATLEHEAGTVVLGLTTSQGIGLVLMVAGAVILWTRRGMGIDQETPLEEAWVDDLVG